MGILLNSLAAGSLIVAANKLAYKLFFSQKKLITGRNITASSRYLKWFYSPYGKINWSCPLAVECFMISPCDVLLDYIDIRLYKATEVRAFRPLAVHEQLNNMLNNYGLKVIPNLENAV